MASENSMIMIVAITLCVHINLTYPTIIYSANIFRA